MLAAVALAAACGAWHPGAAGFYPGTVESVGPHSIDTWIEETADGRLQGHYVLHEPTRDVTGTLDPVGDESCGVTVFRWTDIYGSGLARLQFDLERHCFDGAWGRLVILPNLQWHACARQRVTS